MKKIISCIMLCSILLFGCVRAIKPAADKIETMDVETTQQSETGTGEEITIEQETVNPTSYNVITARTDEEADNIKRELEYPQLVGEGDKYKEINNYIKNHVFELNSPMHEIEEDDNRKRHYACEYKIFYQTEDIISIGFYCNFYAERAAYPIDSYYGLTFDLNTLSIITMDAYFDNVESILTLIDTDNYAVAFGGFRLFTKEEIKEELLTILENDKMSTYIDNFYIDEGYLYFIDNEMPNVMGDYSIIEFPISSIK